MTLEYKILGQVYYGPEINEIEDTPGASGYYGTLYTREEDRYVVASSSIGAGVPSPAAYSTDGITWTETVMPYDQIWSSVAYGDGKFVAVSEGPVQGAAYSTDGITWIGTSMPSQAAWSALAYGDGKFVAATGNTDTAAYSTDGINWTASTTSSQNGFNQMAYGNGKFVAIRGFSNTAAYSTDGITWTASTLPSSGTWKGLAYGNGKFIVTREFSTAAAYSTDGITWTAFNMPSNPVYGWQLAYGDRKFVAIAFGQNVSAYSKNGIDWISTTIPGTDWREIVYGSENFIAYAYLSPSAAYSTDGITWTLTSAPSLTIIEDTSAYGKVTIFSEVANSIGGQGAIGSYIETVEPQVLYTCPSDTETTVTSIYVNNRDSITRTYDLAIVPSGETLSLKHHIRWDMELSPYDFDLVNSKITLSQGDSIYVFPSTINQVGFTAFGVEKS